MNKLIPGLLCLVVLAVLMFTACQSGSTSWTGENWKPAIGIQAREFELPDLEGQPVRLSDFQGRPVIVNFWATWCGPCQHEMPFIQAIYEDRSEDEIVVLTVNLRQSTGTVQEFMSENGYSFPVLLDASGSVAARYQVSGIPKTLLIDKEGIIRRIRTGAYPDQAALEADLAVITGGL